MTDHLKNYLDHSIPGELRDLRRWCNWRRDDRGTKSPLDGASSTDPSTWLSYETARDRYVESNGDAIAGLWFASGPVEEGDELAIGGLDLDHCVAESGEISDERVHKILAELQTYSEYSPTDGVRCLFWIPATTRSIVKEKFGFEFYSAKRWLSVTGNANLGTPRELATFDAETPRRLFERWVASSHSSNGDETPGGEKPKRKTRPRPKAKPKPATGSRRFEDASGVPVEAMVKVAKRSLKLLNDSRADDRGEWINVMCCLKWIEEQTASDLAKTWHKFSKRCPEKYDREGAQKVWDLYEAPPGDRLTISSLLHWASEDSGKAVAEIVGTGPKSKPKISTRKGARTMTIVDASKVKIERVRWLWKGRIPEAKLTIVGGDMGDGKSFTTIDFAARISTGRDRPDGSRCPQGQSLIVNTEDDLGDTVAPRLDEAGADRRQIKLYQGMMDNRTGQIERLDLQRDLPAIEERLIEFPDLRLVVIDPVLSFSGNKNINEYHSMYAILGPLNELAARYNVAIVGNVHTNKAETMSAKHRISGSTAILAACRCAWIVLRDPDSEDRKRRLFLPLKANNSADDNSGLAFRITADDPDAVAHVEWCNDPVEATADDVMRRFAAVRGANSGGGQSVAIDFLKELLKDGPVPSSQVEHEAKAAGTSISACRKHKDKLGIVIRKKGMDKGWCWMLPEHSEPEDDHEDDQ